MVNTLKNYKKDSPRVPVLKPGTVSFANVLVECLVLNLSDGGAALRIEPEVAIPLTFNLDINGENQRRHCHFIWRVGCQVGVSFDGDRNRERERRDSLCAADEC